MNVPINKIKNIRRNSSPSPFNIKLIPSLGSKLNNNTSFINPNNVDYSYSNSSQDDDINETHCPNCISYKRNLQEKKMLIEKLQSQLNKLNSSNSKNNQINSYNKAITKLKNEIENKMEEISLLKLNYDEKINTLIIRNNQLEEELLNMKNNNILLNKSNLKLQKMNKYKENEIKQYKEKVKALLVKINTKNNEINEANNIINNLNKYLNLSPNYNTLAISSGMNPYNNNNSNKAKTNFESDLSYDDEEEQLGDLLKKGNLVKSKSQKINYESEGDKNIKLKKNIYSDKKTISHTPKMSSTQSSWMVSPGQKELMLFQKDSDNNLGNYMQNQKMNQILNMKNEEIKQLRNDKITLKIQLDKSLMNNENLKKLLNQKKDEIIKYKKEYDNKKNELDKFRNLAKSNSTKKIPYCLSTISNNKTSNTINIEYSPKAKYSSEKINDFEVYEQDNKKDQKKNILPLKDLSKGLIDESDDESEHKLKSNKSSSNLNNIKDKILIDKDTKINLLNTRLNEKIKLIKSLELKINELQNNNQDLDEIKSSKEELETKLRKYINENNNLLKKIDSKNNIIKENEFKLEKLKNSLEEKNSIILKNEKNFKDNETSNKDYEKIISEIKNNLSLTENTNNELKNYIKEKDKIIKEKDDNIILLQKKIGILNESIDNFQNDIKKYQNDTYLLKDKINKYEHDININNNELIKLRKKSEDNKNKYEKEIELLNLSLNKNKNEYEKSLLIINGEKDELIKAKTNLELKIKKYEETISNEKKSKNKDKNEIEKLKNEIVKLNNNLNEKELELNKTKKELEINEQIKNVEINSSLNKSINEEIKDKDNEIQKQNEIINNLKMENDKINKELHELKFSLKITSEVKENLDRQIDELNEDIEGLKEKIENLEKEKLENIDKYNKISQEKNNINNQLNELKLELDKEKILSNDKDKKLDNFNNNENELNSLIETINKEKAKLISENKSLSDEIKSLKEKIDSNEKNIKSQEIANELLKADKNQMILRLSSLNEEKNKLKQSLNIFEINQEETNKEIINLKTIIENKEKIIQEKSLENKNLIKDNEKMNDEILLLKEENKGKENTINKKEEMLKELKDELEEKNIQIENTIKNINDYEIQIKGLKDEKQELILKNKKYTNELNEKEKKYNEIKNQYDILKEENTKLMEYKNSKNDEDINKNFFVEIDESQMQKIEEINKLKDDIEDLNKNLESKNKELEKYKTSYIETKNKLDKMTTEFKQKFENNNTTTINNTVNDKTEKTLNEKDTEMSSVENEYREIIKENMNLKTMINQIKLEYTDLDTKYKTINSKFESQEKELINKEKELNNMKEISKAMIEKEKKKMEEEQNIDPSNSTIISSKNHKKLTWYLIYKYNKNNNKQKPDENNYSNYHWIAGNIIRRDKLKNFNNFEDDEKKIMELNQYIFDLQKKLEKKEESISKLDYKNKKLNEQIQNKTAGVKGGDFVLSRISDSDKNKIKNNFANSISSNDGGINEMEKFKKILEQLNDSNKRETLLHNEINELKTKLKKKEEFESGIPQDLKNIDNRSIDSGFLDEDFKQSHNEGVLNFIKESQNRINNNNKNPEIIASTRTERESIKDNQNDTFNVKSEKKADEFLREGLGDDSEYNEVKQMQKQMTFIKKQLKEIMLKYDQLSEQVKELLKNIKCDMKIKPQISQICQILGYSPNTTARIIANKKTGLLGILSGKK